MVKRILLWSLVLTLCSVSHVSGEGIYGKIVDAREGSLISGVKVGIMGSEFAGTSNSKGEYDIDYVPGEIAVTYLKAGYLPFILRLNISQKLPYPAATIALRTLPRPIDWLGDVVEGATVQVQQGQNLLEFSSVSDSKGLYELPLLTGPAEVVISKEEHRTINYSINVDSQNSPKEPQIMLMPKTPGLYFGKTLLSSVKVLFAGKQMEAYKGNLVIPRIPATWEGKYFATGEGNTLSSDGNTLRLYFYPDIPATISSADFLGSAHSVTVLKPKPDGLIALGTPNTVECEKVPFKLESTLEQNSVTLSILYETHSLFLLEIPVKDRGRLVVCDWGCVYGALGELHHPGESAWIIDLGGSESGMSRTEAPTQEVKNTTSAVVPGTRFTTNTLDTPDNQQISALLDKVKGTWHSLTTGSERTGVELKFWWEGDSANVGMRCVAQTRDGVKVSEAVPVKEVVIGDKGFELILADSPGYDRMKCKLRGSTIEAVINTGTRAIFKRSDPESERFFQNAGAVSPKD